MTLRQDFLLHLLVKWHKPEHHLVELQWGTSSLLLFLITRV